MRVNPFFFIWHGVDSISWRIMYFPDAYIYIGSWTVELVVEIICCNPILFREFYLSKLLMVAGYLTLLYFLWSLVFKLYLHQNGYGYSQNLCHGICSGSLQRAARTYFGFACILVLAAWNLLGRLGLGAIWRLGCELWFVSCDCASAWRRWGRAEKLLSC